MKIPNTRNQNPETTKHVNTPKATKLNLTYLIIVSILIVISILIPPPFGSTAGVIAATIGIVYGISIRRLSKKEHPQNNIAKAGMIISAIWLFWNLLILTIIAVGILLFTALSGAIQL